MSTPYKVDRLPGVTQRIRGLFARAKQLGIARQFLDALEAVLNKLETLPFEWGDPKFATRHSGGMVFHGLYYPLVVHYAAFEPERVVCILRIEVFPRHSLEST